MKFLKSNNQVKYHLILKNKNKNKKQKTKNKKQNKKQKKKKKQKPKKSKAPPAAIYRKTVTHILVIHYIIYLGLYK